MELKVIELGTYLNHPAVTFRYRKYSILLIKDLYQIGTSKVQIWKTYDINPNFKTDNINLRPLLCFHVTAAQD